MKSYAAAVSCLVSSCEIFLLLISPLSISLSLMSSLLMTSRLLFFSLVFLLIAHFVSISNYHLFILIFLSSFLFLFLHTLIEKNIDIVEGKEIERSKGR
jgi:hypothetical protein